MQPFLFSSKTRYIELENPCKRHLKNIKVIRLNSLLTAFFSKISIIYNVRRQCAPWKPVLVSSAGTLLATRNGFRCNIQARFVQRRVFSRHSLRIFDGPKVWSCCAFRRIFQILKTRHWLSSVMHRKWALWGAVNFKFDWSFAQGWKTSVRRSTDFLIGVADRFKDAQRYTKVMKCYLLQHCVPS